MEKLKTIIGLTIEEIAWMKRDCIRRGIKIGKIPLKEAIKQSTYYG